MKIPVPSEAASMVEPVGALWSPSVVDSVQCAQTEPLVSFHLANTQAASQLLGAELVFHELSHEMSNSMLM